MSFSKWQEKTDVMSTHVQLFFKRLHFSLWSEGSGSYSFLFILSILVYNLNFRCEQQGIFIMMYGAFICGQHFNVVS